MANLREQAANNRRGQSQSDQYVRMMPADPIPYVTPEYAEMRRELDVLREAAPQHVPSERTLAPKRGPYRRKT